jgi:hypothetical protein
MGEVLGRYSGLQIYGSHVEAFGDSSASCKWPKHVGVSPFEITINRSVAPVAYDDVAISRNISERNDAFMLLLYSGLGIGIARIAAFRNRKPR